MKRLIISTILLTISLTLLAGENIWTKKHQLKDFTAKTTKIVLSGNIFFDSHLQNAIKEHWYLSDYEFCNVNEYEALKDSTDFYFVVASLIQYKNETEPSLRALDVVKGGFKENSKKRVNVCYVPISQADNLTAENIAYLSVIVDIIQHYIDDAIKSDIYSYGNLAVYSALKKVPKGINVILDHDQALKAIEEKAENTVVGYILKPENPVFGASYCFKMIFSTDATHTLYYYKKVKIRNQADMTFTKNDLKKFQQRK